ncbi:SWIM zinc finger family protein [Microlunatus speluncae]|uniref:SWIM zinc finger family protein n=1 Tax=Microlunatus speluncae TaxID=2594267 RepID=UPI0012667986|nr:SWIM zinc finger family protein [Microlunatus speluncae]
MNWNRRGFPPPSKPRAVQGGLKARSVRGAIAKTWWSERFIAVLEDIIVGGRLERGRNYARRGQVLAVELAAGSVAAEVQGSRAQPYRVRIQLAAFGQADWTRVESALADNAWYLAKLLAGEMPDDIESVFAGVGLSLFPATESDLSLDCSCPDWQVPCKHLAAVFYLLAERFDDDPFEILAWRGRARDLLLDNLNAARTGVPESDESAEAPPLTECLDSYFAAQTKITVPTPPTVSPLSLLDQLPALDLSVRGRPLTELIRPVYERFGTSAD